MKIKTIIVKIPQLLLIIVNTYIIGGELGNAQKIRRKTIIWKINNRGNMKIIKGLIKKIWFYQIGKIKNK